MSAPSCPLTADDARLIAIRDHNEYLVRRVVDELVDRHGAHRLEDLPTEAISAAFADVVARELAGRS